MAAFAANQADGDVVVAFSHSLSAAAAAAPPDEPDEDGYTAAARNSPVDWRYVLFFALQRPIKIWERTNLLE